MGKKINRLSNMQVSQLAVYREKWLGIELNTEPTDIPATKAAIQQCYKLAGLIAPQSVICTDSPLSAVKIMNKDEVFNAFTLIWNRFRDHVCGQVWDRMGSHIDDWMDNQVGHWIGKHIWNPAAENIWNLVIPRISADYLVNINEYHYNRHLCRNLAFYDYLRNVCGLVKETEELVALFAISKCCSWWIPRKNVAIIQHRPRFINLDENNRLHCENGMAIKYRDGFGIWAIHGVSVDEQIVMKPGEQTVKQITEEKNVEIKRIRIERFGWNRYIIEISAKVIDNRHNDIENTEETLVRTPDGMTVLLPTCKTGRLFSLEVPSDILTCEQAQNWLHNGSQLDTITGKTRVIGRS